MTRFRSIISRVVALHVIAIGATSILMPLALYWLLHDAANKLHRDALHSQALTVSTFLRAQPGGGVALDMPPEAEAIYSGAYGLYAYAVLDSDGKVLFSSRANRAPLSTVGEPLTSGSFTRRRSTGTVLFGVNVARTIDGRLYWIQVGQDLAHRDVIVDDIVASFFPGVAWVTFPILLALLLIDILIFGRALKPVREASRTAAAIGPASTDVRLPERNLPTEIVPLVHAVNQALERLAAGFAMQREFTADMAHELRTPLAIMRVRVDSMDEGPMRSALQADIVRMARTVNQVLDIAELESFVVAGDSRADLQAVCADAVGFMAPLAVENGQTIALSGAEEPVWVHGHGEALFRAVRNLIENAVRHSPRTGVIDVSVASDGSVCVTDRGPGISPTERAAIFERFWRRDRTQANSHGLGLAIVARVAAMHGGSIEVDNRPGGGAAFTLRLKPAAISPDRELK